MKDFDINLARKGHPVCTRDGKPVRILCYDRVSAENYCIVALIKISDNFEDVKSYPPDGHYGGKVHNNDLMMAPVKHEGWVNVYKSNDIDEDLDSFALYQMQQGIFETKDEALGAAKKSMKYSTHYIATIKIEWEE